jgi:type II secretory pathway component GspD/PulD (secretin)
MPFACMSLPITADVQVVSINCYSLEVIGVQNLSKFRRSFALIWLLGLPAAIQPAWSAEPKWPKEPYNYLVIDQDLRDVLTEFGRNIRVPVKLTDGVARRRVRNDLAVAPPREFLQRLCEVYGLVWYYDGAVLHVSDDGEVRTELLNTGSVNAETLLSKLKGLRITDPRYEIHTSGNSGVVSVSGPPPYVALVRKTIEALDKANAPRPTQEVPNGDATKVRVFRGTRDGS